MKSKRLLLILWLPIIILSSCKHNPTAPDKLQPGSRNYKWTADTIKVPFFTLSRIWGDSYDDVWATGFGGNSEYLIWHFDGKTWTTDSVARPIDPQGLYGLNKDNIWLGNMNIYPHIMPIWFNNGSNWSKFGDYDIPQSYNFMYLSGFCGTSPDNVYAVGTAGITNSDSVEGIIMHFSNDKWSFVNVPNFKMHFNFIKRQNSSGLYFIQGIKYSIKGDTINVVSNYILTFDGKNVKIIYSGLANPALNNIGGEVYIVIHQKIYKYINGSLEVWKDFTGTSYGGRVIGWNEMNFFYGAYDGIGHYNGSNLKTLYKTNISLSGGIAVPDNVFFIGLDPSTGYNVFIRGELQK